MIGRHARPRLFCTFHQNPVYCVKTPGFPKDPHFWSGMLDMLTFWQERPTTFSLGIHSEQQSTRCFPDILVHSWILPLISHHLVQGPWPIQYRGLLMLLICFNQNISKSIYFRYEIANPKLEVDGMKLEFIYFYQPWMVKTRGPRLFPVLIP